MPIESGREYTVGEGMNKAREKKNLNDVYPSLRSEELKELETEYLVKVKEFRDSIDVFKMIEKGLFLHLI